MSAKIIQFPKWVSSGKLESAAELADLLRLQRWPGRRRAPTTMTDNRLAEFAQALWDSAERLRQRQ